MSKTVYTSTFSKSVLLEKMFGFYSIGVFFAIMVRSRRA
jgi:hypothetical protein